MVQMLFQHKVCTENCISVISEKSNKKVVIEYDKEIYKERHEKLKAVYFKNILFFKNNNNLNKFAIVQYFNYNVFFVG